VRKDQLIPVPESVETKERVLKNRPQPQNPGESDALEYLRQLRDVPYKQVAALSQFIDEKTPFSTKHGVKGAEFENVLVVFGRGWNQYNFAQFLAWAGTQIPNDKAEAYERNRNLFYVACSRPKKRLALLFTQELNNAALKTLADWFGNNSIHALT
jgi:DNA helicase-2/ATP-dependent DNA helicase PcrA